MLRNDEFFLRKWVEYYGGCLGKENLYVFFDGEDQDIPEFCNGVNVKKFQHFDLPVREGDKLRISRVNDEAARLLGNYDAVIGTDVDEFLVPDPACGETLPDMISRIAAAHPRWSCISGLGIDVGQNLACEGDISEAEPFLSQRSRAKLSTRYSKATVLLKPVQWGSGFHRVKGHNFHIVKDLYLFHFGCIDLSRIKAKMGDSALVADGWSHHLQKRAKTIRICTDKTPKPWNPAVRIARRIQNLCRPPYAWNKPAMFEAEVVVEIPERFRNTI